MSTLASTKQQDTHTHITYDSNKYFHFPWIYTSDDGEGSRRREEDVVTILILSATVRFYFSTSLCAEKSVTKSKRSRKRSVEARRGGGSRNGHIRAVEAEGQWQRNGTSGRKFYYPHELLTCATMIKLPNVNKMKIYSRAFYLLVCVRRSIKRHIHSKQTNKANKNKRANRTRSLFLSYLRKLYSSYIISLLYSSISFIIIFPCFFYYLSYLLSFVSIC